MTLPSPVLTTLYHRVLTAHGGDDPALILSTLLAEDFTSIESTRVSCKEQEIQNVLEIRSAIPNLKWEPQETMVNGNVYVVRSIVSGTPKGDLFGVCCSGNRSFRIMAIHILTIRESQIVKAYRLEDWGVALNQVQALPID